MKNKSRILILVLAFIFVLSGCGKDIPEMSESERELVTNYASMLLLKYDTSYTFKDRIEDLTKIEEETPVVPPVKDEPIVPDEIYPDEKDEPLDKDDDYIDSSDVVIEDTTPRIPLQNLLGLDSFSIDYKSYEVYSSYPEDGLISADAGKKLIVFNFDVTNFTNSEQEFNLLDKNNDINILFTVNNGEQNVILHSLVLDNYLVYYKSTFAPNETKELVLAIEVKDAVLESTIFSIEMVATYLNESTKLKLQ